MNTGVAYEDLIESVVAAIGATRVVTTLELRTRHQIAGRTMVHEVDVWWRFQVGDRERCVWVSCKDWNGPVGNGAMWEFAGKLDDIDPRPHGVFVVRNRLQSGALKVAAAHGITTWEVREPTEKDWDGRIHTIVLTLAMSHPERELEIVHATPTVDERIETEQRLLWTNEVRVVAADGTELGLLNKVMDGFMPIAPLGEETDWETTTRSFEPPARLVHEDGATQPVSALVMRTRWLVARQEIRIGGPEEVLLVIRDALGDGMSVIRTGMRARADDVTSQLLGEAEVPGL